MIYEGFGCLNHPSSVTGSCFEVECKSTSALKDVEKLKEKEKQNGQTN